jgi:hypothetical protein
VKQLRFFALFLFCRVFRAKNTNVPPAVFCFRPLASFLGFLSQQCFQRQSLKRASISSGLSRSEAFRNGILPTNNFTQGKVWLWKKANLITFYNKGFRRKATNSAFDLLSMVSGLQMQKRIQGGESQGTQSQRVEIKSMEE